MKEKKQVKFKLIAAKVICYNVFGACKKIPNLDIHTRALIIMDLIFWLSFLIKFVYDKRGVCEVKRHTEHTHHDHTIRAV